MVREDPGVRRFPGGLRRQLKQHSAHRWLPLLGSQGWHHCRHSPPVDVAAGTSEFLNAVKKKGERGQQGREIRGKKCIKNSLHKLAALLAAKLTVFLNVNSVASLN